MQHINHGFQKTRAALQPIPVEPHERDAAGIEVEDIALPTLNIRYLFASLALCLLFWAAWWEVVTWLAPYIVRWVE